jgi:dimethylamine/trimethylamine dehydrogenase
VPPAPPSPIRSCRKKLIKAASKTSANVLVATSAPPATIPLCPCAAPKTPQWARNGAAAGTRNISARSINPSPTGLEAARALAKRGAEITLAEARAEFGGRVTRESALPGLAEWARVRDWRLYQLRQMANASLYAHSPLTAADVLDYGIPNVALATGSHWRTDGFGRTHRRPLACLDQPAVISPDALMQHGTAALTGTGPIVIFDDDLFYLGSLLAELAAQTGRPVAFVTSASIVAPYSENTLEQDRIQNRLIDLGVTIHPLKKLANFANTTLDIACVYSNQISQIPCATLVPVTARHSNDTLWHDLQSRRADWADAGLKTLTRIGDCYAPGIIAAATQSGYAYAANWGSEPAEPHRNVFTGSAGFTGQ